MRNLKKVLTLVLTLAMLLSVMVVGAGAATFGDQDSITNKEAVDVCTTLNIIGGYEDGTFRPAGNVTRAEMSKMICVALNGGKEPSMGSNLINTFNDVGRDNWAAPYIEYCVRESIVGGVGGGNFNPNGNITGTQAAKMLLVILGYNPSIQGYVGSDTWETNINVDAAKKGLYAGLESIDASAPLSRDSAAQMIWNALNAYEVEYKTTLVAGPDGTLTSKVTVQDKVVNANNDKITLLEDKYEADTAIGTFAGNHDMNSSIKDGNLQLTNTKINGVAAKPSTTVQFKSNLDLKYIGEEVKVLYRDSNDGTDGTLDDKDTVYGVYVTGSTTVYNVTKNDIQDVDTTNHQIKFNDTKYDYVNGAPAVGGTPAVTGMMIYTNFNRTGSEVTTASQATTVETLEAQSVDTIKFILNDDGDICAAYVTTYDIARVTGLSSTKITLSGVGSIDIDGNSIYSGVAKDDVVVYTQFYDTNKDDAFFAVTKAETVEGKLDGYKVGSGADTGKFMNLVVGGTTYDFHEPVTSLPDVSDDSIADLENDVSIDDTVRVYLVNGMAAAVDSIESSGGNYAVITDCDLTGSLDSNLNGWRISVLLPDGKEETYTVHKDSTSDGSTPITSSDLNIKGSDPDDSSDDVGKIVEYSISGDKIKIKQVKDGAALAAGATKAGVWDKTTKVMTYYNNSGTNVGAVAANDAVLFVKVTSGSSNDFYAYNLRDLASIDNTATTGRTVTAILNDDGLVKAAYVELGRKPGTASSDTLYGIVSAYVGVFKVDGDEYYQYTVDLSKTEQETVYVDVNNRIAVGDLVTFDRNSNKLYAGSELTPITTNPAETTAADTWYIAAANRYSNNTLSYFTGTQHASATDAFVGTTSGGTDVALNITVATDVKLVYVDIEEQEAGEDIGVSHFNTNSDAGGANIIFHTNDDGIVDVIFVQTAETGNLAADGTSTFGKTVP